MPVSILSCCRTPDRSPRRHLGSHANVSVHIISAAGLCAQARKRRLIEGCAAPWAGVPWGAGRECHAGSGRHASQPGTAGSMAVARVFALPPHSPASRVCSSGGAQPRPPSMLPACAGLQGAVGACVFATALHSPPGGGLFSAAGSAAHAHGPLQASACEVVGPPAARMAFPPSRAPRHTRPWRYRFGVVRLRACAHRQRQRRLQPPPCPGRPSLISGHRQ